MHLSCVICSDLFTGTDLESVYATSCGHLFHYPCLLEWFGRSKSCPQCRQKQTEKNITRIYFSTPSNSISDDASTLSNKVDSLSYQLKMKEVDVKHLKEIKGTLEKQNKGLREEIKNMREDFQTNTAQVLALKETITHLKKELKKLNEAKLEAEYLRNKISNYESIEAVLNGPAKDTDEVIARSMLEPMALSMCVSTLKKEIEVLKKQKLQLRQVVVNHQKEESRLKNELKKVDEELSILSRVNKKLKEDLDYSEKDVKSLKQKIDGLEKCLTSPGDNNPRDRALHRMLQESPAPSSSLLDASMLETSPGKRSGNTPTTPTLAQKFKKSELSKTSTIFKIPLRKIKPENITLSNFENHEQYYNGLGGHSRQDVFPSPRFDKFKKLTKKKNLSASAFPSKKLKPDPSLSTLDSFISN